MKFIPRDRWPLISKDAQDELSIIPDSVYKTALLELGDYVVKRDR